MFPQSEHIEQLQLVLTHPFFTGQCPSCQHKLQLAARVLGQCRCPACGWTDEAHYRLAEDESPTVI